MVHGCAMDPNLMRSPGSQIHLQKRRLCIALPDAPPGFRMSAAPTDSGHAFAVHRMSANGQFDDPGILLRASTHQSEVCFPNGAFLELAGQLIEGILGSGHNQYAGGVLVQPVNDTWTRFFGGQLREPVKKRIDHGPGSMTGSRMDHDARRLVQNYHRLVQIQDVQGNGFRFEPERLGGGMLTWIRSPGRIR